MTPNEVRGEFALELDGVEYGLRPTHEALEAIEGKLGTSALKLARAALTGDLTLGQMGTIVAECVRAWGRQTGDAANANVGEKALKPLIQQAGMLETSQKLQAVLSLAVTGGVTPEGEAKPGAIETLMSPMRPADGESLPE